MPEAVIGDLVAKLSMDSGEFDQGLDGITGKLGGLPMIAGPAGIALTAVAAAAGAVGGAALAAAKDLDDAYDVIRVGTGATGPILEDLKEDFRTVFADVPASAEQVGTAIADLNTRLGLTGEPLQSMAEQFLNLARIGKTEVGPLVADMTRVFGDWSISTEDQAESLDFLFRVSQGTGIEIGKLGQLVVQYGAPFRQLGLSFEESAVLMGKFEKEGVNAETILSGMRLALGEFAEAGVDSTEAFRDVVDAIKDAETGAEATSIAFEVFGARAANDMAAAIREGRFEIDDMVSAMTAGQDTINQAASDTEDFAEAWREFRNKLNLVLEPLGVKLMDALRELISYAQPVINFIGSFAGGMEQASPIVGFFQAALADLGNSLIPVLEDLWKITEPIAKLAGAALLGALIIMIKNLTGILDGLHAGLSLMTPLFEAFGGMVDFVLDKLSSLVSWISRLPGVGDKIKEFGESGGKAAEKFADLDEATKDVQKSTDELQRETDDAERSIDRIESESRDYKDTLDILGDKQKKVKDEIKWTAAEFDPYSLKMAQARRDVEDATTALEDYWEAWREGDWATEADSLLTKITDISNETTNVKDISLPAWLDVSTSIGGAETKVGDLNTALDNLGIEGHSDLMQIVADANAARDAVLGSDLATDYEKQTAVYKALKTQIDISKQVGEDIPQDQLDMLARMKRDLEGTTGLETSLTGPWESAFGSIGDAATQHVGNIVDILTGDREGSILTELKGLGTKILETFTDPFKSAIDDLITNGIKKLIGWLIGGEGFSGTSLLGSFGTLGDFIGSIFGAGSGAASTAAGTATGAATGASGSVGSVAGSIVSQGIMGWANTIFAGIGAVGSLGSFIQGFEMEAGQDAIEWNTRKGSIHSEHLLDAANTWWPHMKSIADYVWGPGHTIWVETTGAVKALRDGSAFQLGEILKEVNLLRLGNAFQLAELYRQDTDMLYVLEKNSTAALKMLETSMRHNGVVINVSVEGTNASPQDIGQGIATELRMQGLVS